MTLEITSMRTSHLRPIVDLLHAALVGLVALGIAIDWYWMRMFPPYAPAAAIVSSIVPVIAIAIAAGVAGRGTVKIWWLLANVIWFATFVLWYPAVLSIAMIIGDASHLSIRPVTIALLAVFVPGVLSALLLAGMTASAHVLRVVGVMTCICAVAFAAIAFMGIGFNSEWNVAQSIVLALTLFTWHVGLLTATRYWALNERAAVRQRRGECFECQYPIGTSAVCTECGTSKVG